MEIERYLTVGKNLKKTAIHTSPARKKFWILAGDVVSKTEAKGLRRYRRKVYELRRSAKKQNLIVDVGDCYLVTETLIFDTVSDACSFIMGNSRSGNVAKNKRKTLTGGNLKPQA